MNCILTSCKTKMVRINSHKLAVLHVCPKCQSEVKMSAKLYKAEHPEDKSVEGEKI